MGSHHEEVSDEDSVGIFGMMLCFSSNDSSSPDWCTLEELVRTLSDKQTTHFQGGCHTHQQILR